MAVNINFDRGREDVSYLEYSAHSTKENENIRRRLWKVRETLVDRVMYILNNPRSMLIDMYVKDVFDALSEIEYTPSSGFDKIYKEELLYMSGTRVLFELEKSNIKQKEAILNRSLCIFNNYYELQLHKRKQKEQV